MTYRVECAVRINASTEQVWSTIQDFTRRTEWDMRVVKAEMLTAPPQGKGTRFLITYRARGIASHIENEYIVWKPFERSAVRSVRFGGANLFRSAAGSWHFTRNEDSSTTWTTIVSIEMRGGPIAPLLERSIIGWYFRQLTEGSQRNLKRLIEGEDLSVVQSSTLPSKF